MVLKNGPCIMIELIYIHIPKTGGTSFVETLRDVYGKEYVGRFWDMLPGNEGRLKDSQNDLYHSHAGFRAEIKKAFDETGYRVIHGHIPLWMLEGIYTDIPRITWVREPLEQVFSWLFYCNKQNVKHQRSVSPRELVFTPEYRNMQFFYTGGSLNDFAFVGTLEHYESDLQRLGCILGWKDFEPKHLYKTEYNEKYRAELREDKDFCGLVRCLNAYDIALYERVIKEGVRGRMAY